MVLKWLLRVVISDILDPVVGTLHSNTLSDSIFSPVSLILAVGDRRKSTQVDNCWPVLAQHLNLATTETFKSRLLNELRGSIYVHMAHGKPEHLINKAASCID